MSAIKLKVIVVGESGVGKSSLISRFVEDRFVEHNVTIGVDFKSKVLKIDGTRYSLDIWDTAGCEKYNSIAPSFYRNCNCALIVFDVTNRTSFERIESWIERIESLSNNEDVALMIVGQKVDLIRQVTKEEANRLARAHTALLTEVSAKNDIAVREAFMSVVEKAIEISPDIQAKKNQGKSSEYDQERYTRAKGNAEIKSDSIKLGFDVEENVKTKNGSNGGGSSGGGGCC